jgi:hemin uptake protein HemP
MRAILFFGANEKRSYLRPRMRSTLIDQPPAAPARSAAERPDQERVVTTRDLLGGARRIWIEHAAERYLLQVTRSGKLILTK